MPLLTRAICFAFVGALCFSVQWGTMHVLQAVIYIAVAAAIGFLLSAQLNFVLSDRLTWGDRQPTHHFMIRWTRFNMCVIFAAGINVGVFVALEQNGIWQWSALIIANFVSTVFTFLVNNFIVFGKDTNERFAQFGIFRARA